jgi:hypothetical protein
MLTLMLALLSAMNAASLPRMPGPQVATRAANA